MTRAFIFTMFIYNLGNGVELVSSLELKAPQWPVNGQSFTDEAVLKFKGILCVFSVKMKGLLFLRKPLTQGQKTASAYPDSLYLDICGSRLIRDLLKETISIILRPPHGLLLMITFPLILSTFPLQRKEKKSLFTSLIAFAFKSRGDET